MDRCILFLGEQFKAADFDQTNKNAYIAIAKLAYAILGTDTLLNGFTCTQNSIPDLNVLIGPGEIYQMAVIDSTLYGVLPIDSHIIFKQGINLDALPDGTLTFTAPTTPGDSVNYLIEFALQESDINDENREFYNASPQVVPTIRQDDVFIKALAGTPAPTGTQTTPAAEAGFVGGFVVTIAYGQTTITNGDISVYDDDNFITEKLKDKISQAFADARYAQLAIDNTFTQPQTIPLLGASTYMSAAQSIAATNTDIKVNFDTVEFDEGSLWDATNKRFLIAKAGYYRVSARLYAQAGGTTAQGPLFINLDKNGTNYKRLNELFTNDEDITLFGECIINCAVSDYLEIVANNGCTAAINVGLTTVYSSSFEIQYIGSP